MTGSIETMIVRIYAVTEFSSLRNGGLFNCQAVVLDIFLDIFGVETDEMISEEVFVLKGCDIGDYLNWI